MSSTLAHVNLLDPNQVISTFGTAGLLLIIFAESCVAPLPGDSLLFTAGLLASQHKFGLNLWVLGFGTSLAGILGNEVGYLLGRRIGPGLFKRPDSRFFKQENLERTHAYFEHHGAKTVIIARFVPIIRTFTPMVAGMAQMDRRKYTTYNIAGGFVWGLGFVLFGYFLGSVIPNPDKYLLPLIALVVVVTSIPVVIEGRRARQRMAAMPPRSRPADDDASVDDRLP